MLRRLTARWASAARALFDPRTHHVVQGPFDIQARSPRHALTLPDRRPWVNYLIT